MFLGSLKEHHFEVSNLKQRSLRRVGRVELFKVDNLKQPSPFEQGGVFILGLFPFFSRFWLLGFLASWLFGFLASCLLGFSVFAFLASWLLGFSASWLFGFLASRLLGFLAFRLLGFCFWASWLLGFLASWLFGFLASGLLGFWAFRLFAGLCGFWWLFGFSHPLHSQFLFGRWRLGFCGFSLVYAAFGGFLAFRILCIPSSSSAGGVLAFAAFRWFMRLLVAFWLFASSAFPVPLRQVAFGFCGFSLVYAASGGFWRLWLFASFGLFGY